MTTFGTAAVRKLREEIALLPTPYEVYDVVVPDNPPAAYFHLHPSEGKVASRTYSARLEKGDPKLRIIAVATDSSEVRDMAIMARDIAMTMELDVSGWRLSRPRNPTFTDPRQDTSVLPRVAVTVTVDLEYSATRR